MTMGSIRNQQTVSFRAEMARFFSVLFFYRAYYYFYFYYNNARLKRSA